MVTGIGENIEGVVGTVSIRSEICASSWSFSRPMDTTGESRAATSDMFAIILS